jgi:serine/threonine protein kinase
MPGLDAFSAVSGTLALALQIHDFFQNQLQDVPVDALILAIKNDSFVLNDFARIFDIAIKDQNISLSDRLLLAEICAALQPSLIHIQRWIIRRQTANLTASATRKLANTVVGFLWKQAELQKVATDLLQWTERYHIRLGLLPSTLRERLLADPSQIELQSSLNLRALRETFLRLNLQSQLVQDDSLKKDESETTLRPGTVSTRMFATLDHENVIIEFKGYRSTAGPDGIQNLESEVLKLLKLLNCVDAPLCRILRGIGYFHQPTRSCFGFIYQLPKAIYLDPNGSSPRTLLDMIGSTRESPRDPTKTELLPPLHPLENRFEFARKIACAVMYTHVMGYVHKSIRTSNIIVLDKDSSQLSSAARFPKHLGEPFLCGFETARHDKAISDQHGDAHWRFNIYRHPRRQGIHPQDRYTMNHDVYSLGVVLLELGLWKPLLLTGLSKFQGTTADDIAAGVIRDYLKKLAGENLPIILGTKYYEIVLFCLNIDGDSQVGSPAVVEEVLRKLEDLSIGIQ